MERKKGSEKNLNKIKELVYQVRENIKQLIVFCKDSDPEVRFDAFEAFRKVIPFESRKCLYEALADPDELVRISALEGLGSLREEIKHDRIADLLEDKSPLVRGTAAISLADIGAPKAADLIKRKLESAEDEEKVSYLFSLCKLGNMEFFLQFINFLFHDFYRIRCAVANLLLELVSVSNVTFVLNLLTIQNEREETKAAKSSIENTIRELKKKWSPQKMGRRGSRKQTRRDDSLAANKG